MKSTMKRSDIRFRVSNFKFPAQERSEIFESVLKTKGDLMIKNFSSLSSVNTMLQFIKTVK